jgi:hypothetical protein
VTDGLCAYAVGTGSVDPVAALYRAGKRRSAIVLGGEVLDTHPDVPVIALLAALHGPFLEPVLDILEATVKGAGRAVVQAVAADLRGRIAAP